MSAVEFLDGTSVKIVLEELTHLKPPFDSVKDENSPFYILIETSGSNDCHDKEKLDNFLNQVMQDELVENGIVAQDATQMRNIWDVREMQAVGQVSYAAKNYCYKYDISVGVEALYKRVEETKVELEVVGPHVKVTGYGH